MIPSFLQSLDHYSTPLIPLAVLMASFFGSWHCVAMCGGLITVAAPTPRSVWAYHLGRLIGYGSLGALGGLVGEQILSDSLTGILPWISALLLSLGFILMGLFSWRGPPRFKLPTIFMKFYERIYKGMLSQEGENLSRSSTVGLLSVFLPCGWLYSFVLAAVATKNPLYGALLLVTFWLGSLPALSLTPLLVRKFLTPYAKQAPKIAALLLMSVGVFTLALKLSPLLFPTQTSSGSAVICPGHQ